MGCATARAPASAELSRATIVRSNHTGPITNVPAIVVQFATALPVGTQYTNCGAHRAPMPQGRMKPRPVCIMWSRCSFQPPFARFPRGHEVFNVPQPICDASRHRRSDPKGAMDPDEVVCEVPKRDRRPRASSRSRYIARECSAFPLRDWSHKS